MKHLFQLVCILTPFGVNYTISCAQTACTNSDIICSVLVANATKTQMPCYRFIKREQKSTTTHQLEILSCPDILRPDNRKPLKCLSLRASKQPKSESTSQEASPAEKSHTLKQQSQSAPASTESSPISNSRQINSSPYIKPVTSASEQVKKIPALTLPKMILSASAQTEEPQTPRKKTLQRTTSFSHSSSSTGSTAAPVTPTKVETQALTTTTSKNLYDKNDPHKITYAIKRTQTGSSISYVGIDCLSGITSTYELDERTQQAYGTTQNKDEALLMINPGNGNAFLIDLFNNASTTSQSTQTATVQSSSATSSTSAITTQTHNSSSVVALAVSSALSSGSHTASSSQKATQS